MERISDYIRLLYSYISETPLVKRVSENLRRYFEPYIRKEIVENYKGKDGVNFDYLLKNIFKTVPEKYLQDIEEYITKPEKGKKWVGEHATNIRSELEDEASRLLKISDKQAERLVRPWAELKGDELEDFEEIRGKLVGKMVSYLNKAIKNYVIDILKSVRIRMEMEIPETMDFEEVIEEAPRSLGVSWENIDDFLAKEYSEKGLPLARDIMENVIKSDKKSLKDLEDEYKMTRTQVFEFKEKLLKKIDEYRNDALIDKEFSGKKREIAKDLLKRLKGKDISMEYIINKNKTDANTVDEVEKELVDVLGGIRKKGFVLPYSIIIDPYRLAFKRVEYKEVERDILELKSRIEGLRKDLAEEEAKKGEHRIPRKIERLKSEIEDSEKELKEEERKLEERKPGDVSKTHLNIVKKNTPQRMRLFIEFRSDYDLRDKEAEEGKPANFEYERYSVKFNESRIIKDKEYSIEYSYEQDLESDGKFKGEPDIVLRIDGNKISQAVYYEKSDETEVKDLLEELNKYSERIRKEGLLPYGQSVEKMAPAVEISVKYRNTKLKRTYLGVEEFYDFYRGILIEDVETQNIRKKIVEERAKLHAIGDSAIEGMKKILRSLKREKVNLDGEERQKIERQIRKLESLMEDLKSEKKEDPEVLQELAESSLTFQKQTLKCFKEELLEVNNELEKAKEVEDIKEKESLIRVLKRKQSRISLAIDITEKEIKEYESHLEDIKESVDKIEDMEESVSKQASISDLLRDVYGFVTEYMQKGYAISRAEGELRNLKDRLHDTQGSIKKLLKPSEEEKEEKEIDEKKEKEHEEREKDIKNQLEAIKKEESSSVIIKLKEKVEKLEKNLKETLKDLEEEEKGHDTKMIEALRREIKKIETELEDGHKKLDKLSLSREKYEYELKKLRGEIKTKTLSELRDYLESHAGKIKDQIKDKEKEIEKLKEEQSKMKKPIGFPDTKSPDIKALYDLFDDLGIKSFRGVLPYKWLSSADFKSLINAIQGALKNELRKNLKEISKDIKGKEREKKIEELKKERDNKLQKIKKFTKALPDDLKKRLEEYKKENPEDYKTLSKSRDVTWMDNLKNVENIFRYIEKELSVPKEPIEQKSRILRTLSHFKFDMLEKYLKMDMKSINVLAEKLADPEISLTPEPMRAGLESFINHQINEKEKIHDEYKKILSDLKEEIERAEPEKEKEAFDSDIIAVYKPIVIEETEEKKKFKEVEKNIHQLDKEIGKLKKIKEFSKYIPALGIAEILRSSIFDLSTIYNYYSTMALLRKKRILKVAEEEGEDDFFTESKLKDLNALRKKLLEESEVLAGYPVYAVEPIQKSLKRMKIYVDKFIDSYKGYKQPRFVMKPHKPEEELKKYRPMAHRIVQSRESLKSLENKLKEEEKKSPKEQDPEKIKNLKEEIKKEQSERYVFPEDRLHKMEKIFQDMEVKVKEGIIDKSLYKKAKSDFEDLKNVMIESVKEAKPDRRRFVMDLVRLDLDDFIKEWDTIINPPEKEKRPTELGIVPGKKYPRLESLVETLNIPVIKGEEREEVEAPTIPTPANYRRFIEETFGAEDIKRNKLKSLESRLREEESKPKEEQNAEKIKKLKEEMKEVRGGISEKTEEEIKKLYHEFKIKERPKGKGPKSKKRKKPVKKPPPEYTKDIQKKQIIDMLKSKSPIKYIGDYFISIVTKKLKDRIKSLKEDEYIPESDIIGAFVYLFKKHIYNLIRELKVDAIERPSLSRPSVKLKGRLEYPLGGGGDINVKDIEEFHKLYDNIRIIYDMINMYIKPDKVASLPVHPNVRKDRSVLPVGFHRTQRVLEEREGKRSAHSMAYDIISSVDLEAVRKANYIEEENLIFVE